MDFLRDSLYKVGDEGDFYLFVCVSVRLPCLVFSLPPQKKVCYGQEFGSSHNASSRTIRPPKHSTGSFVSVFIIGGGRG